MRLRMYLGFCFFHALYPILPTCFQSSRFAAMAVHSSQAVGIPMLFNALNMVAPYVIWGLPSGLGFCTHEVIS